MKYSLGKKRIVIFMLIVSLMISMTACSKYTVNTGLSDPNSVVAVENIDEETVLTEQIITECISSEIYLEEIIIAEERITELLLAEESISEVLLCKTIYVPQDNIEEFANNSQVSTLFGDGVDLSVLLKKVTVGTGIIVTLVVLKKVGLPKPVVSVVTAAADKAFQFAGAGTAAGSLFGALTGAADEIDSSGRTAAAIGFATATAGLIISIVSLAGAIPSGGSTTITAAAGIKLIIAGVSVIAASAGTSVAGVNAVKTYTSTDGADIDWENINWEKVGVSAAEQAVNYGADGYVWGAIIGSVYGGVEGYEFYQKYGTPYSQYNARYVKTPTNDEYGHWTGERGESVYVYDKTKTVTVGNTTYEIPAGTRVTYQNAVPDFSPFQKAQVNIPRMTNDRSSNFSQADEVLAEYWTKIKYDNRTWTARDVKSYRQSHGLTWHEMNNMESMQLIPTEINQAFGHLGGVGEYNAMTREEGVNDFG